MKVERSDCEEPGREPESGLEDDEREPLPCRSKNPERFFLNGGDCKGEIVSWCSSESLPSEGRTMGENSGNGTDTEDSAPLSDATNSDDAMLVIVSRRRGMLLLPLALCSSFERDPAPTDCERRSIDRDPRSDSEGIVESWELH